MSDANVPAGAGNARPADLRRLVFDDNSLLPLLYGNHDQNLVRIEQVLGVTLSSRGNQVSISGNAEDAALARRALVALYERLRRGLAVDIAEVDAAIRFARTEGAPATDAEQVRTRRRLIGPRSPGQRVYLEALRERDLVFGLGPAGTGKTYLAVAVAVSMMLAG